MQNISFGTPGYDSWSFVLVDSFGTNRPLWTISLEFWTYAAFAGTFFALVSKRVAPAMLSTTASFVGWFALNDHLFGGNGDGLPLVWLLGAMMYWALKGSANVQPRQWLVSVPFFIMLVAAGLSPKFWPADGTYSLNYSLVIAAGFFLYIALCPRLPPWWTAAMGTIGSFAYTTYLAHYPIQFWMRHFEVVPTGAFGAIAAIIVSFAVSYVLGQLFERHYKSVRDTIAYFGSRYLGNLIRSKA